MSSIPFDLSKIRAFVLDMDGVVSATVSPIGPDGMPMRTVNVKDGYAMQFAVKQGYTLAVISGGASEAMTQRFHQLGAKHVYMRVSDKAAQLDILCQEAGITPDQIAYIGDDIPDIPIMKLVTATLLRLRPNHQPHLRPLPVGPRASGVADFHDVTGGVYKARERIHRSVADLRLLATPPSWGRVADPNPN